MGDENRGLARWLRIIGPAIIAYSVVGLLVDAAIPQLLPENALTLSVGEAAKAGVFSIWIYLIWRIFGTIRGIYGQDSRRASRLWPGGIFFRTN